MTEINFEYYKIFYYVAKFHNITNASNYLYLSQPSVSRCIKTLEEELDCKLFTRSKKGVALTTAGEMLYNHVAIACNNLFSAEEKLELLKKKDASIIRLGGSEVALQSFLVERIVDFHRLMPNIQIKIDCMSTPDAIEALRSNLIDVAVVTSPFSDKTDLKIRQIKKLQDIVVAGSEFEKLKNTVIPMKELVKYPLICLKNSTTTRHYLDYIFRQHNLLLKPDIELTSINLVLPLVKNNLGIGFLQYSMAKNAMEQGEIFQLDIKEPIPPRNICAVTCTKYPPQEQVEYFVNTLLAKEQTNSQPL
ncbi:MAG: LysR family transcriptional regulator [Hominimerdicola sp.]